MSTPPTVPITSASGPFPSDRPTTFTDGYGRSQVLVPIEERDRLADERDDLARRVMEAADALSAVLPGGARVGGRGLVIAVRRLAAIAEGRRRSASNAERLIERIKSGELAWSGTVWTAPELQADRIDHTDPEQIRRAAGVIEGIAMDEEYLCPDLRRLSARGLRQRAEQLETANPVVSKP